MSSSAVKMSANAGEAVLVVEVEFLIATMTESCLRDLGYEDITLAPSLDKGLALARSRDYAFAILDINLNGNVSFPIAQTLRERNIPFGFQTAYGPEGIAAPFVDCPVLTKPYTEDELKDMVERLTEVNGAA